MQIGIAGAGAIGCHYGSMLQQAGYQVRFLGRGSHLAAMRDHGLRHLTRDQEATIAVHADDDAAILAGCDVILLCCKMTGLECMLADIRPHVAEQADLVTMQNGVQAPQWAADAFPEHAVIAGTAFIGARIEQPGLVVHSAAGGVRLGVWTHGQGEERLAGLLTAFASAGVPIREEADVPRMLWRKLLWNCGYNAITALTKRYARQIAAEAATGQVSLEAMQETVAVAAAEGVKLTAGDIDKHIKVTLEMGPVKTSMWQDIEAGRQSEVDFINGYVAGKGEEHGIDTPVNRLLTVLLHAMQQDAR